MVAIVRKTLGKRFATYLNALILIEFLLRLRKLDEAQKADERKMASMVA